MRTLRADRRSALVLDQGRTASLNRQLLWLFGAFWLVDGALTLWATNHGYQEVWNQWTAMIGHTWVFALVKLVTLGTVVLVVRRANGRFPAFIFAALAAFDILLITVTATNVVTLMTA